MNSLPPIERVDQHELRRIFNTGRFWEKAQAGELKQQLLRDGHPAPPAAPVPLCTRSQLISYFTQDGQEVARVHQYLLPDGRIGASGMPDPKRVLHNGILYRLKRQEDR
jgi:hypothetical protein